MRLPSCSLRSCRLSVLFTFVSDVTAEKNPFDVTLKYYPVKLKLLHKIDSGIDWLFVLTGEERR